MLADGLLASNGAYQVKLFKRGGTLGISLEERESVEGMLCIHVCDIKRGSASYRWVFWLIYNSIMVLYVGRYKYSGKLINKLSQLILDWCRWTLSRQWYWNEYLDTHVTLIYCKFAVCSLRTGAVHCGDELLSVDSISLANVRIEDARQILQNTGDIVKLKLRKASKGR